MRTSRMNFWTFSSVLLYIWFYFFLDIFVQSCVLPITKFVYFLNLLICTSWPCLLFTSWPCFCLLPRPIFFSIIFYFSIFLCMCRMSVHPDMNNVYFPSIVRVHPVISMCTSEHIFLLSFSFTPRLYQWFALSDVAMCTCLDEVLHLSKQVCDLPHIWLLLFCFLHIWFFNRVSMYFLNSRCTV
jgi:hypothetical protein